MTPLKCTVAVKGMTVFKEVHTKEVAGVILTPDNATVVISDDDDELYAL